jgi:hypothetical protein
MTIKRSKSEKCGAGAPAREKPRSNNEDGEKEPAR